MQYKYFSHTADAKFRAYGKTPEEQFGNAALAFFNLFVETEKVQGKKSHAIKVEGMDQKALLYNFLEELLFLFDAKQWVLCKVKDIKIKSTTKGSILTATAVGDAAGNYQLDGAVKAITYNDMEIEKGYVQVVVDL